MTSILLALGRAFLSLTRPGVLWHLLWPALVAALSWLLVGALFIDDLVALLQARLPGLPGIGHWFAQGSTLAAHLSSWVFTLSMWFLLLPLIYLTAVSLVSTVALPLMMERVGDREYAGLERRHGGTSFGSMRVSLRAGLLFLVPLVLSLPLWLVPGLGLIVTLLLSARLNRVTFSYDALMNHADALELERLPQTHRSGLQLLSFIGGGLALVPVVNLFAPAFCGLSIAHYLLNALRGERSRPMRDIDITVDPALR